MNQNDIKIINNALNLLDFAEGLPLEMLTQLNKSGHWPETVGEYIVNYIIHPLLTHEWGNDAAEEAMEDVLDCLTALDSGVDKPKTWEALFVAKNKCREDLGVKSDHA